ncbi:hypothetical protein FQR65_LT00465 [Abscondita terminalis]|nr:hypothetical protein FQR65_LT00465 [Abscondita terminalis]
MCQGHYHSRVFEPHMSPCICRTGVDPSVAYNWLDNFQFVNNPCFWCFIDCVGTEAGLELNDNAKIIPELDPHKVSSCQNKTVGLIDPCEMSFIFSKCIHDNFVAGQLDHQVRVFGPHMSKCMCATGVDSSQATNWINKNQFSNDPCFKCFLNCLALSIGILDSQGNYYRDKLIETVPELNQTAVDYCVSQSEEISRCICATGVKPELADQWLHNCKFTNDPCFKCFLKCVTVGVYIFDNDGTFHKDVMMELIPDFNEAELDACANETLYIKDPCEKVYEFGVCIHRYL